MNTVSRWSIEKANEWYIRQPWLVGCNFIPSNAINQFLEIASPHGIRPMLVIFDDCWNSDPKIGPQPAPRPGVHNSGWVQSPGARALRDPASYPRLSQYVKDLVSAFATDSRI